jgi:hypothetical protein
MGQQSDFGWVMVASTGLALAGGMTAVSESESDNEGSDGRDGDVGNVR